MSLKVHLVDDQTFDSLPGKDMGGAVGISYPEKGEAYIRQSGSSLMDAFTIAHELEHLKGDDLDEEYDKENKCYYKRASGWNPFGGDFLDFGQSFNLHPYVAPALAAATMLIPGVGPAIGGALGGAGSAFGGALNSLGMGGLTSALAPIGEGLSGLGGGLAAGEKGLQGLFGIGGAGGANAITSNSWGIPGLMGGGENAASMGGQFGSGALGTPSLSGLSGGGSAIAGGGATGGPGGSGLLSSLGGGLKSIGKALGSNFLGNGLMSLFQPQQQQQQPQQQQNTYQMQNPYNQPSQASQGAPNAFQTQGGGGAGMQGIQNTLQNRNMYGRQM